MAAEPAAIRALMSFRQPRPTSNPYLPLLWSGLEEVDGVEPVFFSWREALFGRWDVLHVQWPETLLAGRSGWRRRINEIRYALLLARLKTSRRALVRTAHNVATHTPVSGPGRVLVRLTERWADHVIRLNESTPTRPGVGAITVPHGHYREWYHAPVGARAHPRRVLFFGLIRPYKGVEELVETVRNAPAADLELRIVGAPADPAVAARVRARAEGDSRIECDLRHLDDDELAAEIAAAAVVVLPYREMHNSGAVLLALSLDRPVLVPDGDVTRALAAEVGHGWVRHFDGSVRIEDLDAALVAATQVVGRPDLSAREWSRAAGSHREAYRRALSRQAG